MQYSPNYRCGGSAGLDRSRDLHRLPEHLSTGGILRAGVGVPQVAAPPPALRYVRIATTAAAVPVAPALTLSVALVSLAAQ